MQDHYRILPTDPRWLALDDEQVMALYYAHHYAKHGVPDEVEDENFDENEANMEELFGVAAPEPAPAAAQQDEFEDVINDRRN